MIIKQYHPFRVSREGYIPDRLHLKFFEGNAEECLEQLSRRQKSAHYHVAVDGTVTALSPLSAAATVLSSLWEGEAEDEVSAARRGILILIESNGRALSEAQAEPLFRLLKSIQKQIIRIYGEPFSFCREALFCEEGMSAVDLLEQGYLPWDDRRVFRVQTGTYRSRREAEDHVQRLQRAGIAAYVTEVKIV